MHQAARDGTFEHLTDRILASYFEAHPGDARILGLHEHDGRVEDYQPEAIDQRARELREQIRLLDGLNRAALTPDQLLTSI